MRGRGDVRTVLQIKLHGSLAFVQLILPGPVTKLTATKITIWVDAAAELSFS